MQDRGQVEEREKDQAEREGVHGEDEREVQQELSREYDKLPVVVFPRVANVQKEIYPDIEKALLSLLHTSGYPNIKFEKKIDFEELYNKKFN